MNERQEDLPIPEPILDVERMRRMVREYYALHAWDEETGVPTRQTLHELELTDFAEVLA